MGVVTHGGSYTRSYKAWHAMVRRCHNPNYKKYNDYGGRGIEVCERWRGDDGYANFVADMGEPPVGLTLEREDNNAGYSPTNCVWDTRGQQQRNRRSNIWLEFNGERLVLKDWAKRRGVSRQLLKWRVNNWGVERALAA